jgi:hypothetical protein
MPPKRSEADCPARHASGRTDAESLDVAHRARVARYAGWFESLPDREKSIFDALAAEDLAEGRSHSPRDDD